MKNDPVNHPPHYTQHPSGIECIQVTEHLNFNIGSAFKYLWRCGLKGEKNEDLKKARWYIDRGFDIVAHVHDEILIESRENKHLLEIISNVMTSPPKWARGLPIKVKTWVGKRYRK